MWWQGLRYGVLGLGDSAYFFYQKAAIQIDRRLEELGGTRILPRGVADDMAEGGLEEGVDEWHSVRCTCVSGYAALLAPEGLPQDVRIIRTPSLGRWAARELTVQD